MWTDYEETQKKTIESSAKNDLNRKLGKWWDDQSAKKLNDKEHTIEPYILWVKKNLIY